MGNDLSDRFDTGMTHREAAERAGKWWNEWRGAISRSFNMVQAEPRVRATLRKARRDTIAAPGLIFPGEKREDLPSGILSGKPWEDLEPAERGRITAYWHHFHIRAPMQAAAADAVARFQDSGGMVH